MRNFFYNPDFQRLGLTDEIFRALTSAANLDTVIPTVWSPVLEKKFEDLLRLQQFAVVNTELENRPGDEVVINAMNDIGMAVEMEGLPTVPISGEIAMGSETPWNNTDIVETAITTEEVQRLVPTMKFKGVKMTLKALNRAFVNTMQDVTGQLANSMSMKMEYDCFGALTGGGTRLGRVSPDLVVAVDNLTLDMSKDTKETFDVAVKLNPMGYFEGDTIVCLLHPYQARDLTDDPEWKDFVKYQPGLLQNVFKGELFNYMGVRYVKSTMVKFYAAGARLDQAAKSMWRTPTAAGAGASKRFYFVALVGGVDTHVGNIMPRYQVTEYGVGTPLLLALDGSDTPSKPKVVSVNYREGWLEFDREIGAVAAPMAAFSYGALPAYDTMWIGPRAFAVGWKQRPRLAKEITNYGVFVGFGSVADWDVRKLRDEEIYKTFTVG